MNLQSQIAHEAEITRAAFAAVPDATCAWNFHHGVELEPLPETPEKRIAFILSHKEESERIARLRNFRPFIGKLPARLAKANADWRKARADWVKALKFHAKLITRLHKQQVPGHTWNGKDVF